MKSLFKISSFVLALFFYNANAQYISKIIKYAPAPGQFINTSAWGTLTKAQSLIGGVNGGISLGAYGGAIVVGFDAPVENDTNNPYGIDFTVFGNPLEEWSELGIVMVMKDENGNGLPDDTWYELAGSDYYFPTTIKNYSITYTNPDSPSATDVPWVDNQGGTGAVYANSFHLQQYYPIADSFPDIPADTYPISGTLVQGHLDKSVSTYIVSYRRPFGYADNNPRGAAPYTIPDNPYTSDQEGCGGDAMDIDWAVDLAGNYVYLDQIDFVKIYTGMNQAAGWLGEVSTEVTAVIDAFPDTSVSGELNMVVMSVLPKKIILGENHQLYAQPFYKGKPLSGQSVTWSVSDASIATITSDGLLKTIGEGSVAISVAFSDNTSIVAEATTEIISPSAIEISVESSEVPVGNKEEITGKVLDINGSEIEGIELGWEISDINLANLEHEDEKLYVTGIAEGNCWLIAYLENSSGFRDSIELTILPEAEAKDVYLTIITEASTIFPRQKITVENFNLELFVDNPSGNYSMSELTSVTLAHAIVSPFDNEPFESDPRFRDDTIGDNQLYIYKIPENIDGNISYYYGYGANNSSDNYALLWAASCNNVNYYQDFHEINIANNDEILVYHVPDSRSSWTYQVLKPSETEVQAGEELEVTATLVECRLNSENAIEVVSSSALAGANIYIDGEIYRENGAYVLTDETGKAFLTFYAEGEKEIQVGTTSAMVTVSGQTITGPVTARGKQIDLWPVPCGDILHLRYAGNGVARIAIYSVTGEKILSVRPAGNTVTINTSGLARGLYFVRVENPKVIGVYKIVKE